MRNLSLTQGVKNLKDNFKAFFKMSIKDQNKELVV